MALSFKWFFSTFNVICSTRIYSVKFNFGIKFSTNLSNTKNEMLVWNILTRIAIILLCVVGMHLFARPIDILDVLRSWRSLNTFKFYKLSLPRSRVEYKSKIRVKLRTNTATTNVSWIGQYRETSEILT